MIMRSASELIRPSTAIWIWVVAAIIQTTIAAVLIATSHGDVFGFTEISKNGERTIQLLAQLEKKTPSVSSSVVNLELLRPVLAATNETFKQLSKLLGSLGFAILFSVAIQIAALFILLHRSLRNNQ